jgi:hypothetical protein
MEKRESGECARVHATYPNQAIHQV